MHVLHCIALQLSGSSDNKDSLVSTIYNVICDEKTIKMIVLSEMLLKSMSLWPFKCNQYIPPIYSGQFSIIFKIVLFSIDMLYVIKKLNYYLIPDRVEMFCHSVNTFVFSTNFELGTYFHNFIDIFFPLLDIRFHV